jgi:hypothetical protein
MGNKQQNHEPRHEQESREGQRLGGNNQGGKADERETVVDQGGQGGKRDSAPKQDSSRRGH